MRKKRHKGKDKPETDGEIMVTWLDLINPKDKKLVKPDTIDNAKPYDWDIDQVKDDKG